MTALVMIIILAIGAIWLVHKKPREEAQPQIEKMATPKVMAQPKQDDEELIAVITAAIAEFTGSSSDDFKVLSIRPHRNNWALSGRQDIMHSRL